MAEHCSSSATRWEERMEKIFISSIYGQELRRSFDSLDLDAEKSVLRLFVFFFCLLQINALP